MTDPFQSIKEIIGSGPFRFVADERVVGSKVVYARNQDYVPRPSGKPDWLAGPKIVNFDRVEWTVMPDPGTAAAALENGEVDWWENPPNDLLPMLDRSSNVRTEDRSPLGTMGTGVFNHLHPPFDKPAVRRIILEATSQADFMTAAAGTDPKMWRDGVGIFTPGTPMASNAGMEVITGPKRDLPTLKKALRDAGYQGERIVFMAPSDQAALTAQGAVALDMLQKLGMDVDYAVMDWGTLVQRRASKEPPAKGGWNMFITGWAGLDMTTPDHQPDVAIEWRESLVRLAGSAARAVADRCLAGSPGCCHATANRSRNSGQGAGTGALCSDRPVLLSHRLS